MSSKGQARIGDYGIGVCPAHNPPVQYTTIFSTGAETVQTDGKGSCVVGTIGISSCGHPTVALVGAETILYEGKGSHRVGDTGANSGSYVVISGSEDVLIGD